MSQWIKSIDFVSIHATEMHEKNNNNNGKLDAIMETIEQTNKSMNDGYIQ